jgi:hypothetical protein
MSFFSSKPTRYCVAVRTEPGGAIFTDHTRFVSRFTKPTLNERYAMIEFAIESMPVIQPSRIALGYTTVAGAKRGQCKMVWVEDAVVFS